MTDSSASPGAIKDGKLIPALWLYNLAFPIVFLLYLPFYLRKLERRGGWREGYGERFARYSASKLASLRQLQSPIWLHAVSVGEVQSALRFIREWQEEEPEQAFILSTTTSTGQAIARAAATPMLVPVYCPLDWYPFAKRALAVFKPAMVLIFEVEVWPNLLVAAHRRKIPLALINCRMSDSSSAGYSKRQGIFRPLFQRFAVITAQSEEDAQRVRLVAGDDVNLWVFGTMKYDQVAPATEIDGSALQSVLPEERGLLVVGASTHFGEEEALGRAYRKLQKRFEDLCMVVVPRHVERRADALSSLERANLQPRYLSELRESGERSSVILGDTTGELLQILASADVVFVGKSFGERRGGQNPIEAALLGKAVLHGPNMDNFRQVIADFAMAEATLTVSTEEELLEALDRLLADPEEREGLGQRAKSVVEAQRGATQRTRELVRTLT